MAKILLDLSDELHAHITQLAEAEDRSVSAQIRYMLIQVAEEPNLPSRTRGTRIPPDFTVTPAMTAWAEDRCPEVDIAYETENFIDHWKASSLRTATKRDWVAAWHNWIKKSRVNYGGGPGARPRLGYRQAETDALFNDALTRAREHDRQSIEQPVPKPIV